MMNFLGVVLIGAATGLALRTLKRSSKEPNWFLHALLGVCGALVATYLGIVLRLYEVGEPLTWILAGGGAVAVLGFYELVRNQE